MPILDITRDPLTCKAYLNCRNNNIPFEEKHKGLIKRVDEFMNKQSNINLLASCGNHNKALYYFNKGKNRWYYIMHFDAVNTIAIINDTSLIIKKGD